MGIFSLSIHIHVHTCYASISVLISAYANNILGYFIGQLYIAFSLFEHTEQLDIQCTWKYIWICRDLQPVKYCFFTFFEVVILHHMLSKTAVKARPTVLWCYKKELGFSR